MKITKKQRQEIDFYKKNYNINPTIKEIEDFINITVHGKGEKPSLYCKENLFTCKRKMDITVKMWRHSFKKGIDCPSLLLKGVTNPYLIKKIKGVKFTDENRKLFFENIVSLKPSIKNKKRLDLILIDLIEKIKERIKLIRNFKKKDYTKNNFIELLNFLKDIK